MERLFISRHSRHSDLDVSIMQVLFPICTLTWRVNNYVSRQGKGINRRNESTKTEGLLLFWYYPVLLIPFVVILETVKTSN